MLVGVLHFSVCERRQEDDQIDTDQGRYLGATGLVYRGAGCDPHGLPLAAVDHPYAQSKIVEVKGGNKWCRSY